VGGDRDIPVNVRVVCATHRDLRKEVQAGRFREDLYFRLVVYPIQVPALRERRSDVPLLVSHFIRKLSPDMGREAPRVAPEALDAMMQYRWSGNVRELQNAIHRALLSCDGNEIGLSHLPQEIREAALPRLAPPRAEPSCMEEAPFNLKEIERRAIVRALAVAKGRMAEAARMLGIGRATIYRKLSEYAIETSADGHE
jgi:DNA-binding NtrC family response regulator